MNLTREDFDSVQEYFKYLIHLTKNERIAPTIVEGNPRELLADFTGKEKGDETWGEYFETVLDQFVKNGFEVDISEYGVVITDPISGAFGRCKSSTIQTPIAIVKAAIGIMSDLVESICASRFPRFAGQTKS